MHGYIERDMGSRLEEALQEAPAVAILGPRQCGKTTLATETVGRREGSVYLDLERPGDRNKLVRDPELYFRAQRDQRAQRDRSRASQEHGGRPLFCLDEIQRAPEIFPVLRSLIDEDGRNGQFLILGSASRDLLRQSSESLAGRIRYLELTPFQPFELQRKDPAALLELWSRGGFPRSLLAGSDGASLRWRESFVRTFLERDIPQLGFDIPAATLSRLWRLLAHGHGGLLNSSKLGTSLGMSHTTVRSHLDLLSQTFMVRLLEPLEANVKKRLVKSPKVYVRDSGILHSLLEIDDLDALLGHPICGESWEGLVIESVLAALPDWRGSFYRTSHGAEIDLILERGRRRIAIEAKLSSAPRVTRGFWTALDDLGIDEAWVVAPVDEPYPLREGVWVSPLRGALERLCVIGPVKSKVADS